MFLFFKKNLHLVFFCVSILFTEIGMGLTQVAVYGSLSNHNAKPFWYGLAFFISLFPGFISSYFVTFLIKRYQLHKINILINIFSSIFLLFPLYASINGNTYTLLIALSVSSFATGFLYTIIQTYIKKACGIEDIPLYAKIDSLLFTANIVIGIGIGSILYTFIGTSNYFILNIFLYLISSLLIYICYKIKPKLMEPEILQNISERILKMDFIHLKLAQKFAILYGPILSFITTPIMSLLPIIGEQHGKEFHLFQIFFVNTAIFIMFSKSIGQMIGPFIVQKSWFKTLSTNINVFLIIMVFFPIFYIMAYYSNNLYFSMIFIIFAHIFSNIISTVSFYIFQKNFNQKEISYFASFQYRIVIITMCICSFTSGIIIEKTSFLFVALLPITIIILIYTVLYKKINKLLKCNNYEF